MLIKKQLFFSLKEYNTIKTLKYNSVPYVWTFLFILSLIFNANIQAQPSEFKVSQAKNKAEQFSKATNKFDKFLSSEFRFTHTCTSGPGKILNCDTISQNIYVTSSDPNSNFLWSTLNGNIISGSTNDTAIVNEGGLYIVKVYVGTDTATCTVTVTQDTIPPTVIATGDSICIGGNIQLTSSGAVTYSWTGPNGYSSSVQNPTRTNATAAIAGNYIVIGTAANGCSNLDTAVVLVNSIPEIISINPNCASSVLQSVTVIALVTPSATLEYNVDGGVFQSSNTFTGLSQGLHIFNVRVASTLCEISSGIQPIMCNCPNITGNTITANQALCFGLTPAPLNGATAVTNPITPFNYQWQSDASGSFTNISGATMEDYNPGTLNNTTSFRRLVVIPGCIDTSNTVTITILFPNIVATGDTVCIGDTVMLSATGGSTYSWTGPNGFSSTNQNPVILSATILDEGEYIVNGNDADGCNNADTVTVLVNVLPIVTAIGDTVCAEQTIFLTSSGAILFSWTGPNAYIDTNQNPSIPSSTVAMSGEYIVKGTNDNGCMDLDTAFVLVNPSPVLVNNGDTVCIGQTIFLNSSGAESYSWTGPDGFTSTDQNPNIPNSTVTMSGEYIVTGTGLNGCTTADTVNVLVNPLPAVIAIGDTVCSADSIFLFSSSASTYNWTGPNGFISNNQNPIIPNSTTGMSGDYIVIGIDINGCANTDTALVLVNLTPVVSAVGDTVCANALINLSSNGALIYNWSGPLGYSSTDQNPVISNAISGMTGNYIVTGTAANGCTASDTALVIVNPLPAVIATADTVCVGETISLVASGAINYSWSGPNGFSSMIPNPTLPNATLAMSGDYILIGTDANGCVNTDTTIVLVATIPTVIAIIPYCSGVTLDSVVVFASVTPSFPLEYNVDGGPWSSSNVFLGLSPGSLYVFGVRVASTSCQTNTPPQMIGCSCPDISNNAITGNQIFCSGGMASTLDGEDVITAPITPFMYQWQSSNGGPFTNISGAVSEDYSPGIITQTTQFRRLVLIPGCHDTSNIVIVTINNLPILVAQGDTVCTGETIVLTSSGAITYSWTGPNGFTSTEQNPSIASSTVAMSGAYFLSGTDLNGCINADTATVLVNSLPTVIATGDTVCAGETISLTSSGALTYNWTGPNGYASREQNPSIVSSTVFMSGAFYVSGTDINGCINVDTATVLVNPLPTVIAAGDTVCAGETINLTSNGAISYNWSGPNSFTSTDQFPAISNSTLAMSGNYIVKGTDINGCMAFDTIAVLVNPLPNVVATGDTVCLNEPINLTSNGAISYNWSGPNNFTSTDQFPTITNSSQAMSGNYIVKGTDINGCMAFDTVVVLVNPLPNCNAGTPGTITCAQPTYLLNGSSTSQNTSFAWSGPGVIGTAPNLQLTSVGGIYNLTVTDTITLCTSTCSVSVAVDTIRPLCNAGNTQTITCTNPAVELSGSSNIYTISGLLSGANEVPTNASTATGTIIGSYNSVTNELTMSITYTGLTDTVTNAHVHGNAMSVPGVNAGVLVGIVPSIVQKGATFGAGTGTVSLSAAAEGFLLGGTAYVNIHTAAFPGGEIRAQLVAVTSATYSWTGPGIVSGGSTSSPTVNQAGTYNLIVTNPVNGCTSMCSVSVGVDTIRPSCLIVGQDSIACDSSTITLQASTDAPNATFSWSTMDGHIVSGASTSTLVVDSAGTYVLEITNPANGCTKICSHTVNPSTCVFDVALRKLAVTTGIVLTGDIIEFSIEVFNQGNVTADTIVITDYLPTGTSLIPGGDFSSLSPTTAVDTLYEVMPNTTVILYIQLKINNNYQDTLLTNNAEITKATNTFNRPDEDDPFIPMGLVDDISECCSQDNNINDNPDDPNDKDHYDPAQIRVSQDFDLAINKRLVSSGSPVIPGDTVSFIVKVYNQGTLTASNTIVKDYLPTNTTYVAVGNNFALSAGMYTTTVPTILPGDSATLIMVLQINPSFMGTVITNNAEIISSTNALNFPDEDSPLTSVVGSTDDITEVPTDDDYDDEATGPGSPGTTDNSNDQDDYDPAQVMVMQNFDLALTKVLSNPGSVYVAGDTVSFTITVYNQGSLDASNVVINDYLPTGTSLLSGGQYTSVNATTATTTIATLNAGSSQTTSISLIINSSFNGGQMINNAEIISSNNAIGAIDHDNPLNVVHGSSNDSNEIDTDNDIDDENPDSPGTEDNPIDVDDYDPAAFQVYAITNQFAIGDPCRCNEDQSANGAGDGTFTETVSITGSKSTDIWTVVSITSFNPGGTSPSNIAIGSLLTYDAINLRHRIEFIHTDKDGFTITVEGPYAAGDLRNIRLSKSNLCEYPVLNQPAPIDYCKLKSPLNLTNLVSEVNGNPGSLSIILNGQVITQLIPGSLPEGASTLYFNYDGTFVDNVNGTVSNPAYPGCNTFVSLTLFGGVGELACNDLIYVSLDRQTCSATITPPFILEGEVDEGIGLEVIISNQAGVPIPGNTLNSSHIGKTFKVSIKDPCTGNSCWGEIIVEDKNAPVITCPQDITVKCFDKEALKEGFIDLAIPIVSDCSPYSVKFSDREFSEECESDRITRTFVATDIYGNSTSCSSNITIEPVRISDLILPPALVEMDCGAATKPQDITVYFDVDSRSGSGIGGYNDDYAQTSKITELNEGIPYAYPHYYTKGFDGKLHAQRGDYICTIASTYTDQIVEACATGCSGNYKVIRTWTILDWCSGEKISYSQIIKAVDKKAPTFGVKDITVSVNPWGCVADFNIPAPWELHDNCDSKPTYTVHGPSGVIITGNANSGYKAQSVPKGPNLFIYKAADCCGNISELPAVVTVIDRSAPVAVALQNIVVSLTGSGTDNDSGGKLFAKSVDNGSYDHCGDIKLEIRRKDGSACGNLGANGYNNNLTFNDDVTSVRGNYNHHDDNSADTDKGIFVKFCCSDLSSDGGPKVHQVVLRVWDDGNMNGITGDNFIIDGMQDNYNETWADVRVENKLPPQIICPPNVTITCDSDYKLSKEWKAVKDGDLSTGVAKSQGLCGGLSVEYRDIPSWNNKCESTGSIRREFRTVSGNITVTCFQTITILGSTSTFIVTPPSNAILDAPCDFNESQIKAADKPKIQSGPCDRIGENITIDTFLLEDGVCKKWRVAYTYINWCTNEEKGPYYKFYKYKDDVKPVLTCQDQMFTANPNPSNPNGGCEGTVNLQASATDNGGCTGLGWLKWQVFVDLWGDNKYEYEFTSFTSPTDNNLNTDSNLNGIPDRYQAPTANGSIVSLPSFIVDAGMSNHKVLWKVTDGCGNITECNSTFMVVDKKDPTPYCISISTALMQNGQVELWAKDFDKGSFDNCTSQSGLMFTFNEEMPIWNKLSETHYFKGLGSTASVAEYNAGIAQKWVPENRSSAMIFNCNDAAVSPLEIKISVWDTKGNTDFCNVTLTLLDNQGACGSGAKVAIGGQLFTQKSGKISNVNVELKSPTAGISKSQISDSDGNYVFTNLPMNADYYIKGVKRDDWLNGVSTIDLVHIQRHILGVKPFDNPYKFVAADANKDGKVSAQDLVALRKLILGMIAVLPNNDSWVFLEADSNMNMNNPLAQVDNTIDLTNVSQDMMKENFIGVKVGDINENANLSSHPIAENRSSKTLNLLADDRSVKVGEVVSIDVTSSNFNDIFGYQFSVQTSMQLLEIKGGAISVDETNYGTPKPGSITMSWGTDKSATFSEHDVLFTLVLKAKKDGDLSKMFSVVSDITKAESYSGSEMTTNKLELNFRNSKSEMNGYTLYQNEPNPFKSTTVLKFNMPEADKARFTITDVSGKVIYTKIIEAVKGMNKLELNRNDIPVSGMIYYTMESGSFTATKAMVIIE